MANAPVMKELAADQMAFHLDIISPNQLLHPCMQRVVVAECCYNFAMWLLIFSGIRPCQSFLLRRLLVLFEQVN